MSRSGILRNMSPQDSSEQLLAQSGGESFVVTSDDAEQGGLSRYGGTEQAEQKPLFVSNDAALREVDDSPRNSNRRCCCIVLAVLVALLVVGAVSGIIVAAAFCCKCTVSNTSSDDGTTTTTVGPAGGGHTGAIGSSTTPSPSEGSTTSTTNGSTTKSTTPPGSGLVDGYKCQNDGECVSLHCAHDLPDSTNLTSWGRCHAAPTPGMKEGQFKIQKIQIANCGQAPHYNLDQEKQCTQVMLLDRHGYPVTNCYNKQQPECLASLGGALFNTQGLRSSGFPWTEPDHSASGAASNNVRITLTRVDNNQKSDELWFKYWAADVVSSNGLLVDGDVTGKIGKDWENQVVTIAMREEVTLVVGFTPWSTTSKSVDNNELKLMDSKNTNCAGLGQGHTCLRLNLRINTEIEDLDNVDHPLGYKISGTQDGIKNNYRNMHKGDLLTVGVDPQAKLWNVATAPSDGTPATLNDVVVLKVPTCTGDWEKCGKGEPNEENQYTYVSVPSGSDITKLAQYYGDHKSNYYDAGQVFVTYRPAPL